MRISDWSSDVCSSDLAEARAQLETLAANTRRFGIEAFPMGDRRGGIVHVVGPEQGRSQPGMTIVCGDSHTSTHGAFDALAFGIGTSEVARVLAKHGRAHDWTPVTNAQIVCRLLI